MKKNTKKALLVTALMGTVLGGGCINFNTLLQAALYGAVIEWVADNDAVFDLFEDGGEAAAE